MSEMIRELQKRYEMGNYPYMDRPQTRARFGDTISSLANKLEAGFKSPTGQAVQKELARELLTQKEEAPPPSWIEQNKTLLIGIGALAAVLLLLKSRIL